MKILIILGLACLVFSTNLRQERNVLAATTLSLQDLLDKIQSITNQLIEENTIEIPYKDINDVEGKSLEQHEEF